MVERKWTKGQTTIYKTVHIKLKTNPTKNQVLRNGRQFIFHGLENRQDAFFHFFSMLLNGAYASKFETGWEP
jgi:hypothetical protein